MARSWQMQTPGKNKLVSAQRKIHSCSAQAPAPAPPVWLYCNFYTSKCQFTPTEKKSVSFYWIRALTKMSPMGLKIKRGKSGEEGAGNVFFSPSFFLPERWRSVFPSQTWHWQSAAMVKLHEIRAPEMCRRWPTARPWPILFKACLIQFSLAALILLPRLDAEPRRASTTTDFSGH